MQDSPLARVQAALREAGLGALWVSAPANVQYLTGFESPEDGRVLVTQDSATLYTDARYTLQAAQQSSVPQFIGRPPESLAHAAEQLARLSAPAAFEADALTVAALDILRESWPGELVPTQGLVSGLRLRKTPAEQENIRTAQKLADQVYAEVRPLIQPGTRELDISLEIELRLRRAGAAPAFETIVASGLRGALPHGTASDKVIQEGELVTVDMGAALAGYNSDMTRTVAVGEVSGELRRIYNAVLEAEQAAVRAVRPGLTGRDLDDVARQVLERHGLAGAFSHSLGHGIGLEVHEGPRLAAISDDPIEAGMVITIEPGVYLPELGGVRIEDLVLVTETGYEVLSQAPVERV
ncbi:M24 family metallopeptidase [Deinococcus lacus]|uniref:M24 family metallopeptidase n=1 Tax=Deinococcus lacus TaxID=392561 RepID=A0ABW1Y9V2_9DEIO